METAIVFVYKKDNETKVLNHDKALKSHANLIINDWSHTETIDACLFVEKALENETQLQKDKEELIEMLEKCKPLISTITRKGKCLPSEIESLIQKHKA